MNTTSGEHAPNPAPSNILVMNTIASHFVSILFFLNLLTGFFKNLKPKPNGQT
jgi:hypothetical protein